MSFPFSIHSLPIPEFPTTEHAFKELSIEAFVEEPKDSRTPSAFQAHLQIILKERKVPTTIIKYWLDCCLFMEEDASKLASQLIEASLVKNAPDDKLDLSSLVTCSFNSLGSELHASSSDANIVQIPIKQLTRFNQMIALIQKKGLYEQDRYGKYGTVVGKYFLLLMDKVASIRGISDDGSDQYINKRELITSAEDVIIEIMPVKLEGSYKVVCYRAIAVELNFFFNQSMDNLFEWSKCVTSKLCGNIDVVSFIAEYSFRLYKLLGPPLKPDDEGSESKFSLTSRIRLPNVNGDKYEYTELKNIDDILGLIQDDLIGVLTLYTENHATISSSFMKGHSLRLCLLNACFEYLVRMQTYEHQVEYLHFYNDLLKQIGRKKVNDKTFQQLISVIKSTIQESSLPRAKRCRDEDEDKMRELKRQKLENDNDYFLLNVQFRNDEEAE